MDEHTRQAELLAQSLQSIQLERERIADWLMAQANFLDPRKVSPMIAVIEIYANTIRSGTYAHPTQEPHP